MSARSLAALIRSSDAEAGAKVREVAGGLALYLQCLVHHSQISRVTETLDVQNRRSSYHQRCDPPNGIGIGIG